MKPKKTIIHLFSQFLKLGKHVPSSFDQCRSCAVCCYLFWLKYTYSVYFVLKYIIEREDYDSDAMHIKNNLSS